ncbi:MULTISPECIES: MBL fold metallo-hydrolase [Sphingobacterium]|uniref:MBL fold metallo-hydrolase n=1 Tax=Sphingobacterium tenebrionis TaxID=3111775 RepID=A0ABU8I7U5_9SPHI|nr:MULTISPECIES: MBL fold metallo-hydrolase [unclassified Sphingobacterium]
MIRYCALASGSNGNSYYIAKGNTAILVDVGINNKHLHLRMASLGINPASIDAIFITHEHTDHICGLAVFAKRYQIPVYLTVGTYESSRIQLPEYLLHFIKADSIVNVGDLSVYGIPKYHDAKEPCSFMVTDGEINISVLTDIGRICVNVMKAIEISDVLFLESNFDEDMLQNGRYPYYLKNRIRGGEGHLSNRISMDAFLAHRSSRMKHLILGHLSGENNRVELVEELFAPHCVEMILSVAKRTEPSALFQIARPVETEISYTSITYQSIQIEGYSD